MKKYVLILGYVKFRQEMMRKIREIDANLVPIGCNHGREDQDKGLEIWELEPGAEFETVVSRVGEDTVRAVVNQADDFQILHGRLVDHFGLAGPSQAAMERLTDKSAMHGLMMELDLGFYRPRTLQCDLDDLESSLAAVQFPVVVKPNMGAKSRGVFVLHSIEDLGAAQDYLTDYFAKAHIMHVNQTVDQLVLIEQFLPGEQVDPVGYVDDDGIYHLITLVDVYTARNEGQDHQQLVYTTVPSKRGSRLQKKMAMVMQSLATATDLRNVHLHPEFKVVGNSVYLLEVNVRIGGFRAEIMREAFGIDLLQSSLNLSMGLPVDIRRSADRSVTITEIWEEQSGIIQEIIWPRSKYVSEQKQFVAHGAEYLAPPLANQPIGRFKTESARNSLAKARKYREKLTIKWMM